MEFACTYLIEQKVMQSHLAGDCSYRFISPIRVYRITIQRRRKRDCYEINRTSGWSFDRSDCLATRDVLSSRRRSPLNFKSKIGARSPTCLPPTIGECREGTQSRCSACPISLIMLTRLQSNITEVQLTFCNGDTIYGPSREDLCCAEHSFHSPSR